MDSDTHNPQVLALNLARGSICGVAKTYAAVGAIPARFTNFHQHTTMSTNPTQTPATVSPKKDIRSLIEGDTFKRQVALALPKHMTPDRFARVALTALTRTPKLMECTRESLLKCLMDCSQLGLEPDGRHAHLIPYKDTCTLIIDYKGLMALARRSGDVAVWRAELVKEADDFSWRNGVVEHQIDWRSGRGETQCVYSYVRFKDGAEDFEVMTLDEVRAIRARSKAANSGPWVTDFDEMAKKTVIRRHSKRLTLSPEFLDAMDKDGDKQERAATGREVPAAQVPQLLSGAATPVDGNDSGADADDRTSPPADAAPPEPNRTFGIGGTPDFFWDKVNEAGMNGAKVLEILHRNQITAEAQAITPEEVAEVIVPKMWARLVALYKKEVA